MDSTNFQTQINLSTSKIVSIVGKQNIVGEAQLAQEPSKNEGDFFEQKENSDEIEVSDSDQGEALQPDIEESEKGEFSDLEFEQSQSEQDLIVEEQDEVDKLEKQNVDFALEEEECLNDEQQHKKETEIKAKPYTRGISLRSFQATLVQNSRDKNSIIYLPTGTGKTRISICSMYYYLCKFGTAKKIVFLANTIQLVKQQAEAIKATLSSIIQNESFAKDLRQKLGDNYVHLPWKVEDIQSQVVCIHGEKNEDQTQTKRKRIQSMMTSRKQFLTEMKKATITCMISQMFLNCLRRGYIKITDYSFIVFDECHHCTGDHPYAGIMKEFYFQQKKKNKKLEETNRLEDKDRLPIIMGLTASPVSQPLKEHPKLKSQLRALCINLDSNFTPYPFENMIIGETQIQIKQIKQTQERELRADLIEFLDKNKDHATAYAKIRTHFPEYFVCVKEVITLMANRHQNLAIDVDGSKITDPELYIFYDIKQCLLLKLRDLWLQLGQFAFMLGLHEMIIELTRLSGLRNAQNTILHKQILQILKKHEYNLSSKYGKCTKSNFSTKVIQLIDILKPSEEDLINQKVTDMVLVFAFKRRTVKFLQLVLDKYRDQLDEKQKNFYKSVGVTGYASRQKIYRTEDGHSYQANPSAVEDQAAVNKLYHDFVETEKEFRTNKIQLQTSLLGDVKENKALTSQMTRMYYSKMGKMLLEVQQKYSNQINKIMSFKRREQRVLITTSVTQQGFDIPGCNLVISFDTPFSLKSYIQIKGRARKKNSKYIIFTNEKSYKKMLENKSIYDNTIGAIFQIALNQISHEVINALSMIEYSPSYKKVSTKGGALLNTNYALDLLKSYFTCLKPPNRAYIHFIQTNNICFRCIIKFPESSTFSQSYVIGKPFSSKLEALRSAAFQAVVLLKKQKFMRQDLRPSRLQQLQDQLQLQKYDDLGMYHKDDHYKEIFNHYVQIQCAEDPNTKKKLVRFYFKSLQLQQLEFYKLNPEFNLKKFQADQQQIFQIYLIKFSNYSKHMILQENEDTNEVGILTSFSRQQTEEIFAGFRKNMQLTSPETFQLKLIQKEVKLTIKDYNYLKGIHTFLISGEKNNQIDYYNSINGSPPVLNPNWIYKQDKKMSIKIDNKREFFPILVLLKKNKKCYDIDDGTNKGIEKHIDLFKKLYNYHNRPSKYIPEKHFQQPLKYEYQVLNDKLNKIEGKKYLLQSISKDFCFHKGFLSTNMTIYDQKLQAQEDKKRGKLNKKYERMKKTFLHFRQQKSIFMQKIVKLQTWKQASKDDINSILSKNSKMKIIQQAKGLYRFLKEFVLYPITYPTMVKISLAVKYVFQVFQDYSIALYFRKYYLRDIFNQKKKKTITAEKYSYQFYKNVVGDNFQKILRHIQGAGKSKYVRQLGRECFNTLKRFVNLIDPSNQSINLGSLNESSIIGNKSKMNILDQSSFNHSINNINLNLNEIVNHQINSHSPPIKEEMTTKQKVNIDVNLLSSLKIDDILRSITSKIYNHQKSENYEEFEFIGDVVLKFLATIQIFIEKVNAEQGEMHIARANLICNANLHRAAIKKKLFLYTFTTKKKSEPAPFIKVYKGQKKESQKQRYNATDINILGSNDEDDGYQYIPGKVHADVMESLIGIFYLKNKNLNDCQSLLYCFDILKMPTIAINFIEKDHYSYEIPECFSRLEAKLSYQFKHKGLLIQAVTHPSFLQYIEDAIDQNNSFNRLLNESKISESKSFAVMSDSAFTGIPKIKTQQTFYQRLQFLGDAFLDLLVVEFLYDKGEKYINDQGTLSFLKQSAVSNKTLGFIALKLGLHQSIFMNLDDVDSTIAEFRVLNKQLKEFPNPAQFAKLKLGSLKILGDVFESLVGAILIDNYFNYESTKDIVMGVIQPYVKHFTDFSFVEQSPSYKCKEYLDQNNYKTIKVNKINEEEKIINGQYLYQFSDKTGNKIGMEIRACNEKDAWDQFIEIQTQKKN